MKRVTVMNATPLLPVIRNLGLSQTRQDAVLVAAGLELGDGGLPKGLIPAHAAGQVVINAVGAVGDVSYAFRCLDAEAHNAYVSDIAGIPLHQKLGAVETARQFARDLDNVLTGEVFSCITNARMVWIIRQSPAGSLAGDFATILYNCRLILGGMHKLFGDPLPLSA